MSEDAASETVGKTLGKKYQVRRLIGVGGMGAVYEVEHIVTRRVGALKLLHQSYASIPQVVERFVREASAAGRIGNRHIIETFDAGEFESGEPYIFMELLSGTTVMDLSRERGKLSLDEALEIAAQTADGLAAAHQAGIVHRDIKPENLFLCSGDAPFVKILDFGVSKFSAADVDQRLTAEGTSLGTPLYMSPEQIMGRADVDGRTDIYSLGVVLYECLTGQVPFQAETLPALSVMIHNGEYLRPRQLDRSIPSEVEAVIVRAMAKDPTDRHSSAVELRDQLSALSSKQAGSFAPTMVGAAPVGMPEAPSAFSNTAPAASLHGNTPSNHAEMGTLAELSRTGAERSERVDLRWVLGLSLIGLVALGALWMTRQDASLEAEPGEPPPTKNIEDAPAARASVTRAQRAAAASAMPPASASNAPTPFRKPKPPPPHEATPQKRPPPKPAKPVNEPSRVDRDGLSVENPF